MTDGYLDLNAIADSPAPDATPAGQNTPAEPGSQRGGSPVGTDPTADDRYLSVDDIADAATDEPESTEESEPSDEDVLAALGADEDDEEVDENGEPLSAAEIRLAEIEAERTAERVRAFQQEEIRGDQEFVHGRNVWIDGRVQYYTNLMNDKAAGIMDEAEKRAYIAKNTRGIVAWSSRAQGQLQTEVQERQVGRLRRDETFLHAGRLKEHFALTDKQHRKLLSDYAPEQMTDVAAMMARTNEARKIFRQNKDQGKRETVAQNLSRNGVGTGAGRGGSQRIRKGSYEHLQHIFQTAGR